LNTVTDAIITLDALGVITGVNPATLQIFGYALDEELVGRNIKVLVPPPRSEAPADFIPRYLASGMIPIDGVRREGLGQQKDGSVFPIDVTVGEIEHTQTFTAVIRDISGRKTLEAEVLRISAEERQRMAADLHDGICQDLVAISLAANVLQKEMQEAADPHAERVGGIEAATLQVAAEARHLARGMSPVVPEGTGLMAALRQLAATTAATHRIKCPFFCRETVQVEDPVVANQLYRIAQEAIHNAVRHGSAKANRPSFRDRSSGNRSRGEGRRRRASVGARGGSGIGIACDEISRRVDPCGNHHSPTAPRSWHGSHLPSGSCAELTQFA
jgi:PAS domain S-box-containing protein